MKRLELDQRCTCSSCKADGVQVALQNATCTRCGAELVLLNWQGLRPLRVGICPGCDHRATLTIDAEPVEPANEAAEKETARA